MRELEEVLGAPDPATRLGGIAKSLNALDGAENAMSNLSSALAAQAAEQIASARLAASAARTAATEFATQLFAKSELKGVGEATWRAMWNAARSYSARVVYPDCSFPHVDASARCPLCQQTLDIDAKQRMKNFESFVEGEIEQRAKDAEESLRQMLNSLPNLPAEEDWVLRFADIPNSEPLAKAFHRNMAARRKALIDGVNLQVTPLIDVAPLQELILQRRMVLQKEKDLITATSDPATRQLSINELRDLKTREWANHNLPAILEELARVQKLDELDRAIKKTSTNALTKKKNEMADEELIGGYQTRFASELEALGGRRLPVKPVEASKAKGKIQFALALVNPKQKSALDLVLSEGEARIVGLAAFLADVSVAEARTPFVFDDPISSLDQDFEERVVKRLINLARTRQVIVFTHRLSLLTLLRDAATRDREEAKHSGSGTGVILSEIALRRLESRAGLVIDTSVLECDVKKATDCILERLGRAVKLSDSGDFDAYQIEMKALCSDVRILVERCIEEELLNKVVTRFRRSITTMNRLHSLAKITSNDCRYLEELMTRFSCFEHSQSMELPAAIPELEEVRKDVADLRAWVIEFKKRPVAASTSALALAASAT